MGHELINCITRRTLPCATSFLSVDAHGVIHSRPNDDGNYGVRKRNAETKQGGFTALSFVYPTLGFGMPILIYCPPPLLLRELPPCNHGRSRLLLTPALPLPPCKWRPFRLLPYSITKLVPWLVITNMTDKRGDHPVWNRRILRSPKNRLRLSIHKRITHTCASDRGWHSDFPIFLNAWVVFSRLPFYPTAAMTLILSKCAHQVPTHTNPSNLSAPERPLHTQFIYGPAVITLGQGRDEAGMECSRRAHGPPQFRLRAKVFWLLAE